MKFILELSSDSFYGDEYLSNKPLEGAILEYVDIIDARLLTTPEEFDKRFKGCYKPWYSEGVGHCINNEGYIQRVFPKSEQRWTIEANTAEELMKIQKNSGHSIILSSGAGEYEFDVIEIYDDYRE